MDNQFFKPRSYHDRTTITGSIREIRNDVKLNLIFYKTVNEKIRKVKNLDKKKLAFMLTSLAVKLQFLFQLPVCPCNIRIRDKYGGTLQ